MRTYACLLFYVMIVKKEMGLVDMLLEFVFELLLEGVVFATKDKKVPLWIRMIIGFLLVALFAGVIAMILVLGVFVTHKAYMNKESIFGGLLIVALGVVLIIMNVYRIYKYYNEHYKKSEVL
ncbi:hypothetical protein ACWG42_14250 [Amedibacillus sp. YH-ame10]